MSSLLRYTAPLFVLLLGLGLLGLGLAADRPVLARADMVALGGRLPLAADLGGAYHSFALDSLPGAHLTIQAAYLDAAAQRDLGTRMVAGAHVRVHVPASEHARLRAEGRAHLHVHGLAVDGRSLLDLDTCLARQADQARSEGRIYFFTGAFLALAGLLLGYARWRAPISRYR